MLGQLATPTYPSEVLVSSETRDDAAVYRLADGRALVQTVDFFTPIVDDAYDWGRIGAANAMSDVYAMGAKPVLALNLVAWPVDELPLELLGRVLEGAAKVATEAGVAIVGGHSIHDPEPKYGMAVTGFAEADRIVRNSTAPAGATLFLTKPLGTGIISTAIKRGEATTEQVSAAVETMVALNGPASEAMLAAEAEAATDVTGYGFLGHLRTMLEASGVAAEVDAASIPLLSGTLELAERGVVPSGTRNNRRFVDESVDWAGLTEPERLILSDAQTSGGLLIATTSPEAVVRELERRGVLAAEVGRTNGDEAGRIRIEGRLPPA